MTASIFSVLSQLARVVSGPLVLLMISSRLDSEVMGFYFTFLNIIALQQVLEMGFGFTIVQFLSHAKSNEHHQEVTSKSYYLLAKGWFSIVAFSVFTIINLGGIWFYSDYRGDVSWLLPWVLLILSVSLNCLLMPYQVLLEGSQEQLSVYRARFYAALVNSGCLAIAIMFDFGLYSLSIASVLASFALYVLITPNVSRVMRVLNWGELSVYKNIYHVKSALHDVWPMLSRISVTWILGYFFWNSFNLISFKLLNPAFAGKLGLTLAMARAGYSIAESFMSAKVSQFSHLIGKNQSQSALLIFKKTFRISIVVLILGFALFLLLYKLGLANFINEKIVSDSNLVFVFTYFILLLPITLQANFCRAFKEEPYFNLSLFMNISMPIAFAISCKFLVDYMFAPLCLINVISLCWSVVIFRRKTIGSERR